VGKRTAKSAHPVRDAAATQRQILDAAEQEFAHHGLKGARMSAIAQAAQVTSATLHYYFENKENLYKAVLQRPVDEVQSILAQQNFDALSPEEALILERGVKEGVFRPLKPFLTLTYILSICLFYFTVHEN